MQKKFNEKQGLKWIGALVLLVVVNILAASIHQRFDLTEDKRYSLSSGTRNMLRSLDDELLIRIFLKGDFPSGFRKLSNTAQEFATVMKETNPARIRYQFINPEDEVSHGKSWGDSLAGLSISPINLTVQVKSGQENKLVFPVALLTYQEQTNAIDLYPASKRLVSPQDLNNAESLMEFNFASAISKLMNPVKPIIGYAVGNGQPMGPETFDLRQTLSQDYQFGIFDLSLQPSIPDTMKALLIVKPSQPFSESQKLKIDQYVMRGGKVIWFIDNLNAEQDSLSFKEQLIAYDRNLNLNDLLFRYGVRINPDLLMDLQCDFLPFAVGGDPSNPQFEFLHWNYYPLFESLGNHMINRNIGLVAGRFVNSLDTVEVAGLKKTFLLQSSDNARTISTPALISPNENRNAPQDALFKQKNIPAAVLLEGRFTSFYKNRVSRAQRDTLAGYGGFRESTETENRMVVVSDGDLVLNDFSTRQNQPLPMGMNLFTVGSQYEYQFANRDFLMNTIEYLISNTAIIEARNKEIRLRLLDVRKVEEGKTKWQLINIALPVLIVLLSAVVYQQLRKRRYAG
jgi:ABC-2 type transport system permease protein